jgi:hypothetical protein
MLPPAWDNRGPSLVVWIIEDVSPHLHALLNEMTTPIQAITLAEVTTDSHGIGWEAGWTIVQDGHGSSVTIFVADDNPSMVSLRVGSQVIPMGEPPWIHYRSSEMVAAVDEQLRGNFRDRVLTTVTFALQVASATMYQSA